MQPSPQSSFRTFPSFQKVSPCRLQSVPTPTPTPRQLLICFVLPVFELSWKWNHARYSFLYLVFSSLTVVLIFICVIARICSLLGFFFWSLNSNYLDRYTRLWTCGNFWVLSIMNNAVIHSSISFCVDIWFYFSWLLGSCWVIGQASSMCVCFWGRGW